MINLLPATCTPSGQAQFILNDLTADGFIGGQGYYGNVALGTTAAVAGTDVFLNGARYTQAGRLRLYDATSALPAGAVWQGGMPFSVDGQLCIDTGTVTNATYINGKAVGAKGLYAFAYTEFVATATNLLPAGFSLTRADPGTYYDSTGLLQTAAIDAARGTYRYNGSAWVFDGTIVEAAATNLVTDVRDMTTANWTRGATITVAQTGTGADGSANACSRLTGGAVAATNRVNQTLVAAASTRVYGPLIRRVTGTGPILITQDGFATTTDVSSLINSSGFTQVGISGSTLNATYGIQVSTNGDVILVDGNQFEAGSSPTSTILTGGATRAADVLTAPTAGLLANGQGFAAMEYRNISILAAFAAYLSGYNGASGGAPLMQVAAALNLYDDAAFRVGPAVSLTAGTVVSVASTWSGAASSLAVNGTVASAGFDGDMGLGATLQIGSHVGGTVPASMVLQSLRLGLTAASSAQLTSFTT